MTTETVAGQQKWWIRLPYLRPPLSLNDRPHWRTRARITKQLRAETATLARAHRVGRHQRIHVELVYRPAYARHRDADNTVPTLKPCIDGLVDAGVIPDDTPEHVEWTITIKPADSDRPAVWLVVKPVAAQGVSG